MHASLRATRSRQGGWGPATIAVAASIAISVATWYLLYRWVGYGPATRVTAHLAFFVAAFALAARFHIPARSFGLGARHAAWAAGVGALAYGAVMGGAGAFNALLGTEFVVLRSRYDPIAYFDVWVLTALGEELLFAGVIFTLVAAALPRRRRWLAVPITAIAFAAMHVPGYLAVGHPAVAILGRLALNAVSWSIFGTIYLLSGNLWLVVVAHAATDLGLTPLVTNEPLWGLAFMALLVAGAWWQGAEGRSPTLRSARPRHERAPSPREGSWVMRRTVPFVALVASLLFLALGGLYGGSSMLLDPSGASLGMDVVLPQLPVSSFVLPGAFLVVVMGIVPIALAYGLVARPGWRWAVVAARWSAHHWAWTGTLALGIVLIVWLALQGWMIGFAWPIQFVTAANAGAIVILALLPPVRQRFSERHARASHFGHHPLRHSEG